MVRLFERFEAEAEQALTEAECGEEGGHSAG